MNAMEPRRPPAVAFWLLAHAGKSLYAEALAGDLIEEFNRGRSARWVWRQVLVAVLQRLAPAGFLKRLLRLFAVIVLGAGTLTWASTVRHEAPPDQPRASADP